jgi:hypothetical protein
MAASSDATKESDPKELADEAEGAVVLYEHALGPRVFTPPIHTEL